MKLSARRTSSQSSVPPTVGWPQSIVSHEYFTIQESQSNQIEGVESGENDRKFDYMLVSHFHGGPSERVDRAGLPHHYRSSL